MKEVFYNDETMLKDLTVGQLKDIIIETLNRGLFTRFEPERRQYIYTEGYKPKFNPNEPYCVEGENIR